MSSRLSNKKFLVIAAVTLGLPLLFSVPANAAYTTSQIDAKLKKGVQSAIDWDGCRTNLTSTVKTNNALRDNINGVGSYNACSYKGELWMSGLGKPKTITPVKMPYNQTSVALQLNAVKFVTGSLVASERSGVSAYDLRTETARWVTKLTDANDRNPNPIGNTGMRPALVSTYRKISSISVVSGGGTVSGGVGSTFETRRNNNSRYWFADAVTGITYTNPSLGSTKTVSIKVTYKEINSYYNPWNSKNGRYYDIYCTTWKAADGDNNQYRNSATGYVFDDINNCGTESNTLTIEFEKQPAPADYNLTPTVTSSQGGPGSSVNGGGNITVTPSVNNTGGNPSGNVDWQLVTFITTQAQAGSIPTAPATGTATPTTYYGFGATKINEGNRVFPDEESTIVGQGPQSVPDLAVGSRICWALAVRPFSGVSGAAVWRYGTPYCLVITKSPLVRILGSDLIVGRNSLDFTNVTTRTKDLNGVRYGSFTEYGVMASGAVSGMASGSGYAGGVSATTLCGVSYLTFANRPNATSGCDDDSVGSYTFRPTAQSVASRFPASSATQISGDKPLNSFLNKTTYTNNAAGDAIGINGGTVPANTWFVVNAPRATVTIKGNIVYADGPFGSISQIPQVVIIAKNIIIADSVSQVDAWLVATGTDNDGIINTCGSISNSSMLNSLKCTTMLTVNGPVIANHLLLYRTAGAGSGAASGDPAEVFNLRPDAYLWASSLQAAGAKAKTVMTTELPPRY